MNTRIPLAIVSLSAFALGCGKPPEAPSKLEDLAGYLFEHMGDEDPEALEAGVENLRVWMAKGDNLVEAEGGYTISRLPKPAVNALDERDRSVDGLVGAALAGVLSPAPKRLSKVLTKADATKVYPETYTSYDRRYYDDPDCFVSQDCDSLGLRAETVSNYAFGLEVAADFQGEYRWIESEHGPALVQRTWLEKPAEVSADWISVPAQYFVSVNIPRPNGKTTRLQATWIAAELGDTPVPEATALNMVVDSMRAGDEELAAWVD
jgi:hypothetical protein